MTETLIIDGDSQPAPRTGVSDAQTWGAIVAGWHGWDHVNCAVGGNTTGDVIARLSTTLANVGSYYVLQVGANNAFINPSLTYDYSSYWTAPKPSAVSVAQTQDDLSTILSAVTAAGKTMTLVTPWAFWSTPELNQFPFYVDALFDWGAQNNVIVIDAYHLQHEKWFESSPFISGAPSMWDEETDYQHPSAKAHALEAAQFRKPRYLASPLYIPA